ncbi:MAG: type II CAAX endopeptidase family protein [Pseudomonadota bacterium]
MPFLSADSLSLVDIAILAVILIGLPLETLIHLKKGRLELASGKPGVRIKHYTQTILLLWGISLPVIVLWASSDRAWGLLGFDLQSGPIAWTGWGLAALMCLFFVFQYSTIARSESARESFRNGLEKNRIMSNFLPHTDAERRLFNVMGVSAGIAEEIVFRGYLIWAFALFMPVWGAALTALAVFTLLHLYQGANQLPAIFMMGALVTLVFLLSGSIWPAIAVHIFVDVINNQTIWKARQPLPPSLQAA